MASFSAELLIEDHRYPLLTCTFGVQQQTHQRGRVSAKVRDEPVQLTMDVPPDDLLMGWAADPHKRLAVNIIFRDADGGTALETLHMVAAYCVSYQEVFRQGDAVTGAYQALLTLADPSGFTMQVGGPALAFVLPAAGTHGSLLAAAVAAAAPVSAAASRGKAKLVPGTPAHKAARWAAYQAKHVGDPKAWSQIRWEKQYDTNMVNGTQGIAREAQYQLAMGAVSKTLKTPLTFRQIDMFKKDERYCGQLKTGKMSLNKQARLEDLPKDAELVKQLYEVEYILEKGASKPFLVALDRAGVTYKIGPQIP
jgi:hypothetical protein